MSTITSCLLNKAAQNLVNSKTVKSVNEIIERLKRDQASGSDVMKELNVAKHVMAEIEDRISQKSRQIAISADLIHSGLTKIDDLLGKGVPAKSIASTFGLADEALSWKYGDVGISALDRVEYNTAVFSGMLTDAFAAMKPKHFAMFRQPKYQKEVIEELFNLSGKGKGSSVVSAEAKKAAQIAFDVSNKGGIALRQAGADLRTLKSFLIGYRHDAAKMSKVGEREWIDAMKDTLDMSKVLEVMPEAADNDAFEKLLHGVYGDLVSGGNVTLGEFTPKGVRSLVNRRSHHRWLQPKDAESYMKYHEKFSNINVVDHLQQYARGVGRDLGVLESYGPKPEAYVNAMINKLSLTDPVNGAAMAFKMRQHAAYITGVSTGGSIDPTIQKWLATARNGNIAGKLGKTAVQALVQEATFTKALALKVRGLPVLKSAHQQLKMLFKTFDGREEMFKELAKEAIYVDGFLNKSAGVARQYSLEGGHRPAQVMSDAVMEFTGLNLATNLNKGSAATVLATTWADREWSKLATSTQTWLANNGVSKEAFEKIQSLGAKDINSFGVKMISPMKLHEAGESELGVLASKMLHRIDELASPTSNPQVAAVLKDMEGRGKAAQIGIGSLRTFTGYPTSWYRNHIRTAANIPGYGAKAATFGAMMTGTLVSGTVVTMIYDMLAGKEPELSSSTVMRAAARTGFIPFLTDYILGQIGGEGWQDSLAEKVAGPTFGAIEGLGKAGAQALTGNFAKAANTAGSEIKGMVPFGNAWFTGLILQRMIYDQLRSAYDPNAHTAFKNQQSRANKQGTPYFWKPGNVLPGK